MKQSSVIVAIVIGVSLIVSVSILSSALRDFGRSLERAAINQRAPTFTVPDRFRIGFESGSSPVRLNVDTTP
jgi:hypothetical protein